MKNKIHNLVKQVFPKIDDYDSRDLSWDPITPSAFLTELTWQLLGAPIDLDEIISARLDKDSKCLNITSNFELTQSGSHENVTQDVPQGNS